MCSDPQTKDGNTFQCRRCNDCLKVRKSGWIARAMMEKALWPHTLCVCLSYNEDTQASRDAARMFQYADVRDFLKRLRSAMHEVQEGARLRFICAGEQGTRNGRCHWHLIIYSDIDLLEPKLGTIKNIYGKRPATREDFMTVGKRKRRLHWSLWAKDKHPTGFVTFQEPDQGGMAYVLSYCLKDQFTAEASKGTAREGHTENFATGLFRMSKRPAIGENWLIQKMETLLSTGSVLPNLHLTVPEMSGFYYPGGTFREKTLWLLAAIRQKVRFDTGENPPQWSSLLASISDNPKELEILNGPEEQEKANATSLEAELAVRQRETSGYQARSETHRRCGSIAPCTTCLESVSEAELLQIGIEREIVAGVSFYHGTAGKSVHLLQNTPASQINFYCRNRRGQNQRHAFPASAAARNRSDL